MLEDFLYNESEQKEGKVQTRLYRRPYVAPSGPTPGTDNNPNYIDQRNIGSESGSNTNQYLTYILIGVGAFVLFKCL